MQFINDIINYVNEKHIDLVIPIGISTNTILSKNKIIISRATKIFISDYDVFLRAHDKSKTIEMASSLNIPIPITYEIKNLNDIKNKIHKIKYPFVIKATKGSGYSGVKIINDEKEIEKKFFELQDSGKCSDIYNNDILLLQEYISGSIYDVCLIAEKGEIKSVLTQKRIRTLPVSGGGGIWNETIYCPQLIEYSEKLIKKLNYTGPAQVEFKMDSNNNPRLMEINPKFWGTLELSIKAGFNFPKIIVEIILGKFDSQKYQIKNIPKSQFIWIFPYQIVYFIKTTQKKRYIKDFIKALQNGFYHEVDIHDLKPHIFQVVFSIISLFKADVYKKINR